MDRYLGQYSDNVAETLNRLQAARRLGICFDGPSQRILAKISHNLEVKITRFFSRYFPDWNKGFLAAFNKWAYLTNDDIIVKAHDDPTYKKSKHGQIIFRSRLPNYVEFDGLSESEAEDLTDLVDDRLYKTLAGRVSSASEKKTVGEDWRHIYFDEAV